MERRTFIKNTALYGTAGLVATALPNWYSLFAASPLHTHLNILNNAMPVSYEPVTTTVQLSGKEIKVHALSTGTVAVKKAFQSKKGNDAFAKLNILLDNHYTAYLPIWVWVIEHPDGLIVIDTGENTGIKNLDKYLAKESAFLRYQFKHAAKFGITEADELNHQFEKINLRLENVKLVALTHLHLDHTDGLRFFPSTEIIVGDYEMSHPNNNMPSTYPNWFKPNRVNYEANRIPVFNNAYPITSNGDLLYIPTPGHTHGHSSIIFKTDEFDIIFAGDTSYNQQQVLNNELAGVNADYKKSKETYKKILDYAATHKTIYLPSHDENAGSRLKNKEFLVS